MEYGLAVAVKNNVGNIIILSGVDDEPDLWYEIGIHNNNELEYISLIDNTIKCNVSTNRVKYNIKNVDKLQFKVFDKEGFETEWLDIKTLWSYIEHESNSKGNNIQYKNLLLTKISLIGYRQFVSELRVIIYS